jgi:CRP-like cAMP-binding protein
MDEARGVPISAIAGRLGEASIFSELSDRNLTGLAKLVRVETVAAGEAVVRRGEPGGGFYLILRGNVEVRSGSRRLASLGVGQFFGEMALLDNRPRSADVVATEPTVVGLLGREEFDEFAESHPAVHKGMVMEMVRRLRKTDEALSE